MRVSSEFARLLKLGKSAAAKIDAIEYTDDEAEAWAQLTVMCDGLTDEDKITIFATIEAKIWDRLSGKHVSLRTRFAERTGEPIFHGPIDGFSIDWIFSDVLQYDLEAWKQGQKQWAEARQRDERAKAVSEERERAVERLKGRISELRCRRDKGKKGRPQVVAPTAGTAGDGVQ